MFWRRNKEIENLLKSGKNEEAKEQFGAPIDIELMCPYCAGATKKLKIVNNAGVDANGNEYHFDVDDGTRKIKVHLANGIEKVIEPKDTKEYEKMRKQINKNGLYPLTSGGVREVQSGVFKGLFNAQCRHCSTQNYYKMDENYNMTAIDVANAFNNHSTISLEDLRK